MSKFEDQYGFVTKKGKLKYPFQGASDSWTLHTWLSREEGHCSYIKNWKEITLPKDENVWNERVKNDPYFSVVLEKVSLQQEQAELVEKRDNLNKQKMNFQKKVLFAKDFGKRFYSILIDSVIEESTSSFS